MPVEPAPTSSKNTSSRKGSRYVPRIAQSMLSCSFQSHLVVISGPRIQMNFRFLLKDVSTRVSVAGGFLHGFHQKTHPFLNIQKQITWVEEVSRKFKTDPIVVGIVECLSPNCLVPKFRYPSSNLGSQWKTYSS